jgi:hypothetical protein
MEIAMAEEREPQKLKAYALAGLEPTKSGNPS